MPLPSLGRTSPELAFDDRSMFKPRRDLSMEALGVDPELMRVMLERRRRQGITGRGEERPTFSMSDRPPGYAGLAAPTDPRILAALLRRKKLMDEIEASKAPMIPPPGYMT
tara:strand:+ start:98 stop:430 length:333 start_codon:yes stop_codon:yes gene_type:complete